MKINGRKLVALAAVSACLMVSGCGGRSSSSGTASDSGITDTSISLGASYPLSGPASAQGTPQLGVDIYWKAVNDRGGIKSADGKTRKIKWTALDDAYEPQKAVANTRRLVEQDKVFAVFNSLGTANNMAVLDYLNQKKVPQALAFSGAEPFYSDPTGHPWTIGWQLPYVGEGTIYAQYLRAEHPNAKVAVLSQNDDLGKSFAGGLAAGLKGGDVKVVANETYEVTDPTVAAQVTNLSRSGADVLYVAGLSKQAAQAIQTADDLGWKPTIILASVASSIPGTLKPAGVDISKGVLTSNFYKDPSDATLTDDPAMKQYMADVAKYCAKCDPYELGIAGGYAAAQLMAEALQGMKKPTRQALMDSLRDLRDVQVPMMLDGVIVNTSATDGYPVQSAQILRFNGTSYDRIGDVIEAAGQ